MSEYKYSGLDLVNMLRNPDNVGRKFVATNELTVEIMRYPARLIWREDNGDYDAVITKQFLERRFKDPLPEYELIDFGTAMDLIKNYFTVYVKSNYGYQPIKGNTFFNDWPYLPKPNSIADLVCTDFYRKIG